MIRVSIVYEHATDASFDFAYYADVHLKLAMERLEQFGLIAWQIQKGQKTMRGQPDIVCITHLDFNTEKQMQAGFAAHGTELQADFSNYTNIEPRMVLCDLYATSKIQA